MAFRTAYSEEFRACLPEHGMPTPWTNWLLRRRLGGVEDRVVQLVAVGKWLQLERTAQLPTHQDVAYDRTLMLGLSIKLCVATKQFKYDSTSIL
jgi:hypothetical protein